MRLPEESEEKGMGMPVIYTILAVSAFILVILGIVLVSNQEKTGSSKGKKTVMMSPSPTPTLEVKFAEGQEDIETLYRENKLRSEDLDFWDMYKDDEPVAAEPTASPSPTPTHEPTPEEMAADGKHTMVTDRDGEEVWLEISKKIPENKYDLKDIKIINGKMYYYQDGEKSSKLGVDLSKNNGTVDFAALKADGVDFVMLKIGGRGYDSGVVTLDENFFTNLVAAKEAGLEVGVYFFSQAITVGEAEEEAKFVIDNLAAYKQQITYPVVFDMEYIANDDSRIELLDAEDRTEIAEAFLSSIEAEGYYPMIYGNKNWLLLEILPEKLLAKYDVWLSDQSTVLDYPYSFKMWKYALEQTVSGVEGTVSYTISFVDYTRK